jgi:hypothetical protein
LSLRHAPLSAPRFLTEAVTKFVAKKFLRGFLQLPKKAGYFKLSFMQQKRGIMKFALATAIAAIACAFTVRADEAPRMAPLQTALSSTVISGYVQAEATFTPAHNAFAPMISEFRAGDRNSEGHEQTRPILLNSAPESSTGYDFMESDGATTMGNFFAGASATLGVEQFQFTSLTPSLQPQTEIQSVPEPSATVLGSVALGFISAARWTRRR